MDRTDISVPLNLPFKKCFADLQLFALLQAEQGCIHYQLYKEAGGESGSYAMIETWATQVHQPANNEQFFLRHR